MVVIKLNSCKRMSLGFLFRNANKNRCSESGRRYHPNCMNHIPTREIRYLKPFSGKMESNKLPNRSKILGGTFVMI